MSRAGKPRILQNMGPYSVAIQVIALLIHFVDYAKYQIAGIVLGLARLRSQIAIISGQQAETIFNVSLRDEIGTLVTKDSVPSFALDLKPGRPSPICSPALGATMLRFKLALVDEQDLSNLKAAVDQALKQEATFEMRGHQIGGDEVLAGRAGLLAALLDVKKEVASLQAEFDGTAAEVAREIEQFANDAIPKLTKTILKTGKESAEERMKSNPELDGIGPISWLWVDSYHSLGAVHGITGILAVLLNPQIGAIDGEVKKHYPEMAETISALCRVCIENNGNLPMSIPPWPSDSTRSSPLVQICHGIPGLLLLLAAAALNIDFSQQYYKPEWIETVYLGSRRVWDNGILSKGGGLCHGIAGNAWPLLILHDCFEYACIPAKLLDGCSGEVKRAFLKEKNLTGDWLLSRALRMLQECSKTRPFENDERYRMPDHPYSLFEGLAGTMCAWTEAVLTLQTRIIRLDAFNRGEFDFPKDSAEEVKARFLELLEARRGFPGIDMDFSCFKI